MVGKSSRSNPVFTSSGLVISTSMPRSTWSRIQSSRREVSTEARSTATFSPDFEHFLQPGRSVARPAIDRVGQDLAALRFFLEAEIHQRLLLGHQLLVAEDRWHEGQGVPGSRMLDDLRSETAVRPARSTLRTTPRSVVSRRARAWRSSAVSVAARR